MTKNIIPVFCLALAFSSCRFNPPEQLWLHDTDLNMMETGWGTVRKNLSCDSNTLSVAGKIYDKGVGTHAVSKMMIDLFGRAESFSAETGVDDESGDKATIEFFILADQKVLWRSGLMKKGDPARKAEVSLRGFKKLALYVSDGGDNINYDHADWLNAFITYRKVAPVAIAQPSPEPYILTPPPPETPKINGPAVTGAGPGKPFLFRIPASGRKPITFSAIGLPATLRLDPVNGIIEGTAPPAGDYKVLLKASNELGETQKEFHIITGKGLALTPPMGWNCWNCWGLSVDDAQVRDAADAFIQSGLADHGWCYINIDDGWESPERNTKGEIAANQKFPDMNALSDYIHGQGLKLGIYSSPGPLTCGGYLGSYNHEGQDAGTWAHWGIDYLKYDWCSYGSIATDNSLPELQKPYLLMREKLDKASRDIVFSLCQYGMGNVWEWGGQVGGNLWRTTGDITDTWASMAGIGFSQDQCSPYAGPGQWNDPDMLVVGQVGWGPSLRQSRLTPDEQYTHISLWCLLSAPLLIGCDLSRLDPFTLNLLTNDEVIAVNQDELGKQAVCVRKDSLYQAWAKPLMDGSIAVGIFNSGNNSPVNSFYWGEITPPATLILNWKDLGIDGTFKVRDLWRQQENGEFNGRYSAEVPYHGVALVKVYR